MLLKKRLLFGLICCFSFLSLLYCSGKRHQCRPPKLTVVIIIDQFAYHYIPKLKPFLKYGLNDLLASGVVYENAFHPHGVPETTPGHHGICVGTCAKDHGAIANDWMRDDGSIEQYADDPNSPIIGDSESEVKKVGRSNKKTRVDGLSDQFVMKSTDHIKNRVFALSLKAHPALSTAGRLGKAIWLNSCTGRFISSKAYFDELPDWVKDFNENDLVKKAYAKTWESAYPHDSAAYDFSFCDNYEFSAYKRPMIGTSINTFTRDCCLNGCCKNGKGDLFVKTPHSSEVLFELAKSCVKANFKRNPNDRLLLYVSVSNLDLLTHMYGPDCREPIDTIYHIDRQIQEFKGYLEEFVDSGDLLIVLTADHGIGPIPEISSKNGFALAKRIMADPLVKKMNDFIDQEFGIKNIVLDYEPTSFRLSRDQLSGLGKAKQKEILLKLKHFLKSQPGIKNAWTRKELLKSSFEPDELESFYKNQIYKNRTGDIICQPEPYCQITKYPTGTSHMTPYDYDTHVPLVIYQKRRFEKRTISTKVWIPQLPVTLAKILGVGRPSAGSFDLLPGVN